MICPLCNRRKARRFCPALGKEICAICCGTKRLVEIRCPSDCPYLATSRSHPPSVVKRQHERDIRFLGPMLAPLEERAVILMMVMQDIVRGYRPGALPRLTDHDVQEAAGTLASTYETAARGIVYEHQPAALQASRLNKELETALARLKEDFGPTTEKVAPVALRTIEQAARTAAASLEGGDTAYLDLIERMAKARSAPGGAPEEEPVEPPGPRLIIAP